MILTKSMWRLTRATVMMGLAWAYNTSSVTADAYCWTGCNVEWNGSGQCISIECKEEKGEKGHSKCAMDETNCKCPGDGDDCKGEEV